MLGVTLIEPLFCPHVGWVTLTPAVIFVIVRFVCAVLVHPLLVTVTEYVPDEFTILTAVVGPLFHR